MAGAGGAWAGGRLLVCGPGALLRLGARARRRLLADTTRTLRASAATALLPLPVGDGGGSYEVAFAESGVSHVR